MFQAHFQLVIEIIDFEMNSSLHKTLATVFFFLLTLFLESG